MGKRHILALVLMVVVMAVWSLIFGNRMSKQRSQQEMERQRIAEQNTTSGTVDEEGQDTSSPVQVVEPPQPKIPSTPVHIKTDQYEITFAPDSATATRWGLKGYPNRSGVEEQAEVEENPINLIPSSAQNWLSLRIFESSFQDGFDKGQIVWEGR